MTQAFEEQFSSAFLSAWVTWDLIPPWEHTTAWCVEFSSDDNFNFYCAGGEL